MEEVRASLFVATPMYGGVCHGQYTAGLLNAAGVFSMHGISMSYSYMMNESLITRARNSLAHDFLESGCSHLMFIDADIGFNPHDIVRMVDANCEIICGMYPKKEINWFQVEQAVKMGVPAQELHKYVGMFVVNSVDGTDTVIGTRNEPVEIMNGGTGFMLIKREVFEQLADKVPEYNSDMFKAIDTERKPVGIKEFFATSIDEETGNRLLSEDYHFCKLARKNGIKIWAAPWAHLTHCGSYIFDGSF